MEGSAPHAVCQSGVGTVSAYGGEGLAQRRSALILPERYIAWHMGAEAGATTSIFPSDEVTRQFMAAQDGRLTGLLTTKRSRC